MKSRQEHTTITFDKLAKHKIDQKELEKLWRRLPRICFYCGWFQMRKEIPHNRQCTYPGKIEVKDNVCQMWEPELDGSKRKRSFV